MKSLFRVEVDGKVGYIDSLGQIAIKPKFEFGGYYSEGLTEAGAGGKRYFINLKGDCLSEHEFSTATSFSEGMASVIVQEGMRPRYNYSDANSHLLSKRNFDNCWPFSGGLALVMETERGVERFGLLDRSGHLVLPPILEGCHPYSRGEIGFSFRDGGKWGIQGIDGRAIVAPKYDDAGMLKDDLCPVCENGQWGVIDSTGSTVIKHRFEGMHSGFSEGLIGVQSRGLWGFVSRSGEEVVAPNYPWVGSFTEGLSIISKDEPWLEKGKFGVITKTGEILVDFVHDTIWPFENGLAAFEVRPTDGETSSTGYMNRDGKVVWEPTR
ncbi:MAG: WG repeat-containing protein [Proteobacteria bacterium]|nr:WG repeat-containing protein [Pseudomonadota bacterium]